MFEIQGLKLKVSVPGLPMSACESFASSVTKYFFDQLLSK